jgi:hypothetical protein
MTQQQLTDLFEQARKEPITVDPETIVRWVNHAALYPETPAPTSLLKKIKMKILIPGLVTATLAGWWIFSTPEKRTVSVKPASLTTPVQVKMSPAQRKTPETAVAVPVTQTVKPAVVKTQLPESTATYPGLMSLPAPTTLTELEISTTQAVRQVDSVPETPAAVGSYSERPIDPFLFLSVSGAMDITIERGDVYSMEIAADEGYERYLKVSQTDRSLSIRHNPPNGIFKSAKYRKIHIKIKAVDIDRIEVSGAVAVTINGEFPGKEFLCKVSGASEVEVGGKHEEIKLELSGASRVKLKNIEAAMLEVEITGASTISVAGVSKQVMVTASGASTFLGSGLQTDEASLNVTGASVAQISVSNKLKATASGSSKIVYQGNPPVKELKSTGASIIRLKN